MNYLRLVLCSPIVAFSCSQEPDAKNSGVGLNVEGLEGDPVVEEGKYYTHIEEYPRLVVSTVGLDIDWPNGHCFH